MEAEGLIDSPAVRLLRNFAASTSSHIDSHADCLRDLNGALWRTDANPPRSANTVDCVSGAEPWPRLGLDP